MKRDPDLERRKEKTIEHLAVCYSEDRISMDEYEALVDRVNSADEITSIMAVEQSLRLPAGNAPDPGEKIVTVLGERKMLGDWITGRHVTNINVLGSTLLDLTQTGLPGGKHVHIVSLMGEVTVLVPRHVRVKNTLTPILAEVSSRDESFASTGPSEITITGVAVMSEVKIRRA